MGARRSRRARHGGAAARGAVALPAPRSRPRRPPHASGAVRVPRTRRPTVWLAGLLLAIAPCAAPAAHASPPARFVASDSLIWPAGSQVVRFENLEGLVLLHGVLEGRADRDTSGLLALDTGAGYLALDRDLARILGLVDEVGALDAVDLAPRALPGLHIGGWTAVSVEPVLTVDGAIVRRVSDRPVLGLLGHQPLQARVLWIDYRQEVLVMIPAPEDARSGEPAAREAGSGADRDGGERSLRLSRALFGRALTTQAVALPFRLVGDGKMLLRGAVAGASLARSRQGLNLILDTGATKCVLFEDTLDPGVPHADWPAVRGLVAPTLLGTAPARIARVPALELETARAPLRVRDVDVGVIQSELAGVLARVTRETIHGLIGYSLLKRFRVAVDYPNRVLWLDPIPDYRDDRPFEYSHVGLQLERRERSAIVLGVIEDSPAARAGIAPGDELVSLDGAVASELDLADLTRRMEGRPGSPLTLVIRRDAVDRTVHLVRRRLL